ncbi:MAG: hypothetical protein J5911_04595 [Clostridia bacterium]|nr:hypothetical protein [Clostridia bacterium]
MITEILSRIFGALSLEMFLSFCVIAVFAAFIACLFLSVLKTGYGLKRRAWYLAVLAFFCALCDARAIFMSEKNFASIMMCFGTALFIPLFFIRVKRAEEKSEDDPRREFVRYLDDSIRRGDRINAFDKQDNSAARSADAPMKVQSVQKEMRADLDFSHVKSVLQRLQPATLSYSDRKQIRDLELLLYEAENGECDAELKGRINEGLGNLLKIMAKHGV